MVGVCSTTFHIIWTLGEDLVVMMMMMMMVKMMMMMKMMVMMTMKLNFLS